MAVELTATYASFTGVGSLANYAAEIYADTASQIRVTVDGALKALGDDYTLSGLGVSTGVGVTGNFTLGSAVYVERVTARTQEVDTQDNETILEAVLDAEFDKLTMIMQEIGGQADRAVVLPKGESGYTLPSLALRLAKVRLLGHGADGVVGLLDPSQIAKGDPGGNAMAIGLFNIASTLTIPVGTDAVQTSGYSVVGQGIARYSFDATVDAAYVIAHPRTSFRSVNGRGFKLAEGAVSIAMYGAVAGGVVDCTAAIQAAIDDSDGSAYRSIFIPQGDFRTTDTIRLNKDFIRFYGAGDKSCIYFDPTASGKVMLLVQNSNPLNVIKNIVLDSFSFRALYPSAFQKTGIKLIDATTITIRDINITDYSWVGGAGFGSIGLSMNGRDTHEISNCVFIADQPIYIDVNPNSTYYTFDYHHFSKISCVTRKTSNYAIRFAPGVNPSNWILDGNSGAFQGKGGIFLDNNSAATQTPSMIRISHFRCESGTASGGDPGGYGIYMDFGGFGANPACGNILLENLSVNDPTCNAYFFNNVSAIVPHNINCGFGAVNAWILNNVGTAIVSNLGIGNAAATVQFNSMFAQRLSKFPGASPTSKSIAFAEYKNFAADLPANNLVYENDTRKWSRRQDLNNAQSVTLPSLAAGESMMVQVSSGYGAALYSVINGSAFVMQATAGWAAACTLTNVAGVTTFTNTAQGSQRFFFSSMGA